MVDRYFFTNTDTTFLRLTNTDITTITTEKIPIFTNTGTGKNTTNNCQYNDTNTDTALNQYQYYTDTNTIKK